MAEVQDFSFPFPPYHVQLNLMKKMYDVLDKSEIGLFESPTGTGKSLSIICSSLTWYYEHLKSNEKSLLESTEKLKKDVSDLDVGISNNGEPAWFSNYGEKQKIAERLDQCSKDLELLRSLHEFHSAIRDEDVSYDEFDDLFAKLHDEYADEENSFLKLRQPTQIIYCSRTHSQLTQFISEVKKTKFIEKISMVTLASRDALCINSSVRSLGNINAINDSCLKMKNEKYKEEEEDDSPTKRKNPKSKTCPYYVHSRMRKLSTKILSSVIDIEDLAKLGASKKTCPYYSSRKALPLAQLVVVPYSTIIDANVRTSSQISLKNNVLIIDESHNILNAIENIHSSRLSLSEISLVAQIMADYIEKYKQRLTPRNLLYCKEILAVLKAFRRFIKNLPCDSSVVLSINDFLIKLSIDNINIFELVKYFETVSLAERLCFFAKCSSGPRVSGPLQFLENLESKVNCKEDTPSENVSTTTIYHVRNFFKALNSENSLGKIVVKSSPNGSYIKFLALDTCHLFADFVQQCRSIILIGGTMKPTQDFNVRLFNTDVNKDLNIVQFSCGHVVPSNHIHPVVICSGPNIEKIEFSYKTRLESNVLSELCLVLTEVVNVVPGGVIVFFSSFEFIDQVCSFMQKQKCFEKIQQKKRFFIEPKSSADCEMVLKKFAAACDVKMGDSHTGALLFSVVGGKLSEGINFSDNLGRCVIMVGMPFANVTCVELKAKMRYLSKNHGSFFNNYLEHMCMKAVNQCIGRVIRHRDDFAAILLFDWRYSKDKILEMLPRWISSNLQVSKNFQSSLSSIKSFFDYHHKNF